MTPFAKQAIEAIIKHEHSAFLRDELGRLYDHGDFDGMAYVVNIALQRSGSSKVTSRDLTDICCFFSN